MKRFHFVLIACLWGLTLASAADRSSVVFCSYNLKNYLRMERTVKGALNPEAPKPEREIAAVVKFLADIHPDVLGVCEIGTEDDLKDLQSRLKEAGLDLPNSEYCHGGDPHRRLGLLTRFPIVARASQTELRYLIGDQIMPVQRGFLDCSVRIQKGFDLRCVGVHLKSKRPVPDADEALMRRNEAHLLRKHLDTVFNDDANAKMLLYGDFNDERSSPSLVEISGVRGSATGMQDLFLTDSRRERWTHYWQFQDIYSRLDYIFVSQAMNGYISRRECYIYDNADYYQGSDHRPLVARFYLTKR